MIRQNLSKPKNEALDLSSAGENIHNIRTNMEDIFSNDENKKKAIKYVIDLGKTKNIHNSPRQKEERYKKSASPLHYQQGGTLLPGNVDSFKGTPNRTYYDGRGNNINTRINQTNNINNTGVGPNTISNFYPNPKNYSKVYNNQNRFQNPIQNYNDGEDEEYYENQQNFNNINPEESQNDYEISSLNNVDDRNIQVFKYSRSPEPRMVQKAQQIFNDRYQNAARKQNYPRRQKDIQMMPRQRNQISNYNNNDPNLEEEMDELIRTIEEMQSIINGQKNEIKNNRNELSRKNKEMAPIFW